MLVLSRKTNERILIGDNITITLIRVRGNTVRLGIEAPREIRVIRGELNSLDRKADPVGVSGQDEEFLLSDREQAFAHPEPAVVYGRVKLADGQVTSIVPLQSEAADSPGVGKLRRASHCSETGRAPLARFVSAT